MSRPLQEGLTQAYKRLCGGFEHTKLRGPGVEPDALRRVPIGANNTYGGHKEHNVPVLPPPPPSDGETDLLSQLVTRSTVQVATSGALPCPPPCTCDAPHNVSVQDKVLWDDCCEACGVTPTYPPLCPLYPPPDRYTSIRSRVVSGVLFPPGNSRTPGSTLQEADRLRHVARRYASQITVLADDVRAAADALRGRAGDSLSTEDPRCAQRARDLTEQLHLGIALTWTFQLLPPAERRQVAQLARRLFSRLPQDNARAFRYGVTHHRRGGVYGEAGPGPRGARARAQGGCPQYEYSPLGSTSNPRSHNWDRD